MQAVVFHGIGDIRLEDVAEPKIKDDTDAIVRITASAICGTDLHFVRGTVPGLKKGTILGHEAVGVVEEVGKGIRNLRVGDRVVVPSTVACGYCSYCRAGYFAKCDNANPKGNRAPTVFFGGPVENGGLDGLQAELARIPFANVGLVKLPENVSDDQAILISDIFPTAYFGARLAEVKEGDTVCVFGCGPVGQFAIASAKLMRAGRIFAVDCVASRLEMARSQGAEVINFEKEDPTKVIVELTGGIGVDRVIDAVGVDAQHAHSGPAGKKAKQQQSEFEEEVRKVAPEQHPKGENWKPGDGPSQVLRWAVEVIAKAGTLGIIGVYPPTLESFPIGQAMAKNLTIKAGDCNHRRYIPKLVDLVASGAFDPTKILTQVEPMADVIDAYKAFDRRAEGWIKVELKPSRSKGKEKGHEAPARTRRHAEEEARA
jgi:threonine dehydrogenase-like Zn-dependent dehydrogenase